MCSSCAQVIFNILLIGATGLLLAALFTPSWANWKVPGVDLQMQQGLIKLEVLTSAISDPNVDHIKNSVNWDEKKDWEKAVLALLVLSVVACGAAFAWSIVACMMCCCKACLTPPLPVIVLIACALDAAAVVVFVMNQKDKFNVNNVDTSSWGGASKSLENALGYSFFLAAVAAVVLFADFIVGICLVKISKVSPI